MKQRSICQSAEAWEIEKAGSIEIRRRARENTLPFRQAGTHEGLVTDVARYD
ncbi:hypothetical protein X971_4828 (plasmid) [Agrobacterium tumefaciens LBA4213 (Ach5)]|nr:hypothetical protein X971_4828 [Agrobacterium tumefaciens LBA4213 (Ach5)]